MLSLGVQLGEKLKSMSRDEKRILLTAATYVDFGSFGRTYLRLELSAALEIGDYVKAAALISTNEYEIMAALTYERDRMLKAATFNEYTPEERSHSAYLAEVADRLYKFLCSYYFGVEE